MERRKVRDHALDKPLHIKYRPRRFADVVGQDAVVKSLRKVIEGKTVPHTYLFTGPSGCGKTTLARILADSLGVAAASVLEVDAASNSGIDAMRAITETLQYQSFGDSPNRMVILDECHGLSRQAWDSLLKVTEEPLPHVFFAFCTTNPEKVPATVLTRTVRYDLKACDYDSLMDLLESVVSEESMQVEKWLLPLVAKAAGGSPRHALVLLAKTEQCETEEEARALVGEAEDSKQVIDLARLLLDRRLDFRKVQETILSIRDDVPPETVRILIVNYLAAVLLKAKSSQVPDLLDAIAQFSKPMNPSDKWAPILLAFGNLLVE